MAVRGELNVLLPDRSVVSTVTVGRDGELDFLNRAVESAGRGLGQVVLITGEAGVGKTRLVAEVGRRALGRGFVSFRGYCFEADVAFPFAPVIDGLRACFFERNPSELARLVGPLGVELVKLVPELGLILPDVRPSPPLEPQAETRRLFEVLLRFLGQLAGDRPLLGVFEDLHWADGISLDFLHFLARRIQNRPVLVLLSYRLGEAARLGDFLGRLNRERLAAELVLQPLGPADVDRMVRAILGSPQRVPPDVLDLLYRLTEGNPFFIEEVLKGWAAAGLILRTEAGVEWAPPDRLVVPRNVHGAVRQRLPRLSPEARELLSLAAVTGRRFDLGILGELTGQGEAALLERVSELVRAQLVAEEAPGRFVFRHPLTLEAVLTALMPTERRALHRRVVAVLEKAYAGAPDSHAGDLACHYHAAGRWDKALEFSVRAAERAQTLYAPHEAIEHLNRALEAAGHLQILAPLEVLRARGKARETVGYHDQARADYEEVLRRARAAGDQGLEWRALLDLGLLWAARDLGQAGEYLQAALALARGRAEPSALAETLNAVGSWHAQRGEPAQAVGFHREALGIFQELNDLRGVASTLDLLGLASHYDGDVVGARGYFEEAAAIFRRLGDRQGLARTLANLTLCGPGHQHNLEVPALGLCQAVATGEEAVKVARAIRWRAGEIFAMSELALQLTVKGHYRRALDLGEAALSLAADIGHRQWLVAACRSLGRVYLEVLAWEEARAYFEMAYDLLGDLGSGLWAGYVTAGLALTCIARGDLDAARQLLGRILTPDTPAWARWQRQAWGALAELALAENNPELALDVVAKLREGTRNLEPGMVLPRLWALHGAALAQMGRYQEAETVLLAAERCAAERGLPGWVWRLHAELGRLYRAWGRREAAVAHVLTARRVVKELAEGIADAHLRQKFITRAVGLMPPAGRGAADAGRGGLTPREWQVARLVADGKSNREIADALIVGERTVESHVARIMAKLGVSARAGVAAWVKDRGPEAAPEP